MIRLYDLERPLVLDRAEIPSAHERIMQRYGVPEDHYLGAPDAPTAVAPEAADSKS